MVKRGGEDGQDLVREVRKFEIRGRFKIRTVGTIITLEKNHDNRQKVRGIHTKATLPMGSMIFKKVDLRIWPFFLKS